jgi:FAD/FMN-containing dehydrogenase
VDAARLWDGHTNAGQPPLIPEKGARCGSARIHRVRAVPAIRIVNIVAGLLGAIPAILETAGPIGDAVVCAARTEVLLDVALEETAIRSLAVVAPIAGRPIEVFGALLAGRSARDKQKHGHNDNQHRSHPAAVPPIGSFHQAIPFHRDGVTERRQRHPCVAGTLRYPDQTMPIREKTDENPIDSDKIGPGDPRYAAVVEKRFNQRFRASPDYVRMVSSTEQVVSAVQEAVTEGRRLTVTSGGHCLEGFVSDPDMRVILDISPMKGVDYDREMGAVAVEAGATVGETFRALYERWGVVIPLGEHPDIGMGGHVAGGAFGFLCRQFGLAADYLYGVEVVTVDEGGHARTVVATRETSDPHRELWWGHTGGGAGNFGIVTRYWFRAAGASGDDPTALLPRAPESITTFKAEWNWSDIDQPTFLRLLRNHGAWCERNSDADSPNATLWTLLEVHRQQFGKIVARGVSTADASAGRQVDDYLAALGEGIAAAEGRQLERMSWLEFAINPFPDLFAAPPGGVSVKVKDALLRQRFTDRQIAVAYDHLTSTGHDVMAGMLGLATYGGRINTIAHDATASAQRCSILDIACTTGWLDAREEAQNLAWVREFYRDLFAETGGVPVPGDAYDGAFINHPDIDLANPAFNGSGVPWHTLYYKTNYPRLQRIKARWDPRNVFRHALSIRVD